MGVGHIMRRRGRATADCTGLTMGCGMFTRGLKGRDWDGFTVFGKEQL